VAGTLVIVTGLVAAIILGQGVGRARPLATGGSETSIAADWRPLAWSPDGSALLVRSGSQVAVVAGETVGEPVDARWAGWWPGEGHARTRVSLGDGGGRLVIDTVEGEREVTRQGAIATAAWSGDGQRWALGNGANLRYGRLDGRETGRNQGRYSAVAWSPAGDRAAARFVPDAELPDRGHLRVLDPAGGPPLQLTSAVLAASDRFAWSPDASRIAFTARFGEATRGLYLVAADGSAPATHLADDVDPASVRWSADGAWLAASRAIAGAGEVFAVRIGGGQATITPLGPGGVTGWDPHGHRLLTVDANGSLVLVDIATQVRTVLAAGADPACTPAWSGGSLPRIAYCGGDGTLRTRIGP
jgi:Tol biopolymer transport system component